MEDTDGGEEATAASEEAESTGGRTEETGIESLPTVGAGLGDRLRAAGYETVADVQAASLADLTSVERIGEQTAVILLLTAGASPDDLGISVASLFDDLEDLPTLNSHRADALREAGFDTPAAIREASMDDLTEARTIDTDTARTLKRVTALIGEFDSPVVSVDLSEMEGEMNSRHLHRQERTAVMMYTRLHEALSLGSGTMRFASQTLKRAIASGFLQHRSFRDTVYATVVVAARATDDPRTIAEVAAVDGIDKRNLGRVVVSLTDALGLDVGFSTADDYVDRSVDEIERIREANPDVLAVEGAVAVGNEEFADRVRRRARELLDARPDDEVGIYQSQIVAAGAVYAAYLIEGVPVTQPAFADAFDTNLVSIRKHYTRLLEDAGYEGDATYYQKAAREAVSAEASGD